SRTFPSRGRTTSCARRSSPAPGASSAPDRRGGEPMRPRHATIALSLVLVGGLARGAGEHGAHGPGAAAPPLLAEGLGVQHHAVTTGNREAQRYFDQGLRLVYAFNHDEAARAFREAARLDPGCAMAWWGVALAAGPNYNLPIDDTRDGVARDAMAKAIALAPRTKGPLGEPE